MKKLIYSKEDLDLILTLELEKKDKEIERLTKRLEESQLAYLQVDKDKQRLKNDLIEEKKAYIRMYNQWVDEKEKIFIALEFIIQHMGYYSSKLSQSEEMYVNDLNKLVNILKGKG